MSKTVKILIEVEVNSEGSVRSSHRPLTEEDVKAMQSLPSGGVVQIAHAMFLESLRREAYTMAITQLSAGVPLGELHEKDLDALTRAHILEMCAKFSPQAAQDILKMLKS